MVVIIKTSNPNQMAVAIVWEYLREFNGFIPNPSCACMLKACYQLLTERPEQRLCGRNSGHWEINAMNIALLDTTHRQGGTGTAN